MSDSSAAKAAMANWPVTSTGVDGGGSYLNYTPGPPTPYQYKAPSGVNGAVEFYRVDVKGFPVWKFQNGIWNQNWKPDSSLLIAANTYRRPYYLSPALSDSDDSQIALTMANSGLFKDKTTYLTIGDEPYPGDGVIDFKSLISDNDYTTLRQYLTLMPRQLLWDFYMKNIWGGIPYSSGLGTEDTQGAYVTSIYGDSHLKKSYEDMVWAGLVDLFNSANLDYINANQITAQAWENQKTTAYYQGTSDESEAAVTAALEAAGDVSLSLDPKAMKIMNDFATLPKLGDPGFEVNRQNALKQLLLQKEYVVSQAIVDAYRYADDTIIGAALKVPIPVNLVGQDGTVLALKT